MYEDSGMSKQLGCFGRQKRGASGQSCTLLLHNHRSNAITTQEQSANDTWLSPNQGRQHNLRSNPDFVSLLPRRRDKNSIVKSKFRQPSCSVGDDWFFGLPSLIRQPADACYHYWTSGHKLT